MDTPDKEWFERTLLQQDHLAYEDLGSKRILFSTNLKAPLVSVFFDPVPIALVKWKALPSVSLFDSFFQLLLPVVAGRQCAWFLVRAPQDEYIVLEGVSPVTKETWNSDKLYFFQNHGAEGGAQSLCLAMDLGSVLVFTLKSGFEVAFYGSDDLWNEIALALNAHAT